MGVSVYNWRMRSTLYHKQIYPTVAEQTGFSHEFEIYYPGYMSGFNPMGVVSIDEVRSINKGIHDDDTPYATIAGGITGFSSANWHTACHVVASDGSNYAVGFCIIGANSTLGAMTRYYGGVYVWSSSDPSYWHGQFISMGLTKGALEDTTVAYNKLSEYIYLTMRYNEVGYPTQGGVIYHDAGSDQDVIVFVSSFDNYLIPALRNAGDDTDVNPDPQPTPIANDDPYAPGGSAWTGGGSGSFDPSGDDVGIPNLPNISATSTGFITLFNPSVSQLNNLCDYMWSDLFDLDTFKKIFADPMQCILGLSIVPIDVPAGGSAHVKVGNIDTGVSMTKASKQYVEVDCGSISIEEYSGSYLDYDPYTEVQLYLPYVGIHPLKTDDVMNKTITVKYHVDILSGACVAYVKCGASVLYSFVGQCSSSIPITGNDWTNVINGALSIAGSIGSMVATGGANAPTQVANIASTAVNSMKPQVEKSGSMSGTGGLMAIQTPYLIITRPNLAIPEGQNRYTGYPSYINIPLGSIKGYTEVEKVHLNNIPCTESELNEIEKLLKGGVIL